MAKWLVTFKLNKKLRNFFLIILFFGLYVINHLYIGLEFANPILGRLFYVIPFLLLTLLAVNIFLSKKEKLLAAFQILVWIILFAVFSVGAFVAANESVLEKIEFDQNSKVEVFQSNLNRNTYLMQEQRVLLFFNVKKCLYSFSKDLNVSFEKKDSETLNLYFSLKNEHSEKSFPINSLSFFKEVYICDSGENVEPYRGISSFLLNLFEDPSDDYFEKIERPNLEDQN